MAGALNFLLIIHGTVRATLWGSTGYAEETRAGFWPKVLTLYLARAAPRRDPDDREIPPIGAE